MKLINPKLVAVILPFALVACGSDSSSDSTDSTDSTESSQTGSTEVKGTVTAPGGSVAMLKHKTIFESILDDVFPSAYAAITGLEPVKGALVELIRIDDEGNQVGDVIATTSTSTTGDYTITVPEGVPLAGNLIVRISGNNGINLRAQVVEESVDISPISEFVLQKFIQSDTSLAELTTDSVVKLKGQVEEFNVAGSSDMTTMIAALENELGDFVDKQVASISTASSSAVEVSGDYRLIDMTIGLHDGSYGTYALNMYSSSANFDGDVDGNVEVLLTDNEGAWGYVHGDDVSNTYSSVYEPEVSEDETLSFTYDSNRIFTIENEFEEEIDDDFGWRSPPQTVKLHKVKDSNLVFSLSEFNSIRYETIDTDGDGVKDALDPEAYSGAEIERGILVLAEQPSNMSQSDLIGDFGRIYFGSSFNNNGYVEIETETNVLTFSGASTLDFSAPYYQRISRSGDYVSEVAEDEAVLGMSIVTDATGDIASVGGEPADGFVNADYNFMAVYGATGADGTDMSIESTLAVKLPSEAPALENKKYRLIFANTAMSGNTFELAHSGFNTTVEFESQSSATVKGPIAIVELPSFGAALESSKDSVSLTATTTVASNGATTLSVMDGDESLTLKGYFNETASLGIFTTTTATTGSDPYGLGLAILVEID
ncbi:hypothetical protein [Vibrio mytili]|uniref:Lipoprotein n=1 Tax=Vibrio mytili TaxID=50718 RepID=A0A0C3DGY1_9VIBR|nr:hypothetical protein [Vibrio mytili]KIN10604.1 hypothetical protein SU60_13455 [Vibrio mytili]